MLLYFGIDSDWLFSGNDERYVKFPAEVDCELSNLRCSQEGQHHQESKDGTIPKPVVLWPNGKGDTLKKHGGTCLGALFSRSFIVLINYSMQGGWFESSQSV
jgi:hypothetical protein